MKNKPKTRGPGRPKKGCIDLAVERTKVLAGMKASAERLAAFNNAETEDGLQTMLSEKKLKQCTKAELKELRRMAERLWDQFEIEKQYAEDMEWTYGTKREPTPQSKAWDEEHELLKPKRKKTNNIRPPSIS